MGVSKVVRLDTQSIVICTKCSFELYTEPTKPFWQRSSDETIRSHSYTQIT